MLPANWAERVVRSGIVLVRPDRGREDRSDARTVAAAVGSGDARSRGRAVRADERPDRAHQCSRRAAGRRRPERGRDRLAGAPWTRPGGQDPAPVRARGCGRAGAGRAHRPTAGVTPAWLAELQRVIALDPHTVGV